MIEFNDGSYGLLLEYERYVKEPGAYDNDPHYGRPWRVRIPTGEDRWHSANSFKRKI